MKEIGLSNNEDNFFCVRIRCIIEAYMYGFDVDDPDKQAAPWLKEGVRYLREGKFLCFDDLQRFDKAGGTDHPDPFFR